MKLRCVNLGCTSEWGRVACIGIDSTHIWTPLILAVSRRSRAHQQQQLLLQRTGECPYRKQRCICSLYYSTLTLYACVCVCLPLPPSPQLWCYGGGKEIDWYREQASSDGRCCFCCQCLPGRMQHAVSIDKSAVTDSPRKTTFTIKIMFVCLFVFI